MSVNKSPAKADPIKPAANPSPVKAPEVPKVDKDFEDVLMKLEAQNKQNAEVETKIMALKAKGDFYKDYEIEKVKRERIINQQWGESNQRAKDQYMTLDADVFKLRVKLEEQQRV